MLARHLAGEGAAYEGSVARRPISRSRGSPVFSAGDFTGAAGDASPSCCTIPACGTYRKLVDRATAASSARPRTAIRTSRPLVHRSDPRGAPVDRRSATT